MKLKLNLNGQTLRQALDAVRPLLNKLDRQEALANAEQIVSVIARTYETRVKTGEVGKNGKGSKGKIAKKSAKSRAGLIYGRIQSGKTRAMITSAALAFDNKFRVVVVVTSNNNRLVRQTHQDFRNGLPGNIGVYSKAHFTQEVQQARQILNSGQGGIVLICSKGAARLPQAIQFLRDTGASQHPAVIFDDEGDQATLDTNTLRRSKKPKNTLIPASTIHQLIHNPAILSLRRTLPRHIFVSVTGTPSGIVLQNIDNRSRPAFIELLEAGKHYVGGNFFFSKEKPGTNQLVTLIDENERIKLLGKKGSDLPEGLKGAIRFFLLAAAAAGERIGWPDDDRGYKLLCHPSVKNVDQEKVAKLVRQYIVNLSDGLADDKDPVHKDFQKSYDSLKKQTPKIPRLDSLLATIRINMASREVLILNKNTTGDELNYSRYFNFLIGGNTLGRGLAIKNLLVTYYVREAKTTQMDTMYQHARMFGYRKSTLPYTRVFLPPQLYARFRQIFVSDEELRKFIENNKGAFDTLPVRIAANIRATRSCVLDARKVEVLVPGKQIYPNYPFFSAPQAGLTADKVRKKLAELFPNYVAEGRKGTRIGTTQAQQLVSLIKTNGTNAWSDRKVPKILSYLSQQFKNGIVLKYRQANRTPGDSKGLLEQGVLTGKDVIADSAGDSPVLWVFEMRFKGGNSPAGWDGSQFFYPTIVLPKNSPLVVFNKS
jgi:Z1 domain